MILTLLSHRVKDEITAGGGQIDHEYTLIKGFRLVVCDIEAFQKGSAC